VRKASRAGLDRIDPPGGQEASHLRQALSGPTWLVGTRHRLRLGGMALTLTRDYRVTVTCITLPTEQLAEAQARAEAEG
jgi:hypothetical protein